MSPTSYQTAPPRVRIIRSGRSLFAAAGIGLRLGTVDELDERHRRVVADAEAHLQDARVAARTRLVARAEFGEQLRHDVAIAQAIERKALVRKRGFLAERDHRFDDAAQ